MTTQSVTSRWQDSVARKLDEPELHAYLAELVGSGTTSLKRVVIDALGRRSNVISMRAREGDVTRLRLDDLEPLADYRKLDDNEAMAFAFGAMVDPREIEPPIESLAHAFVPDRWIVEVAAEGLLALSSLPDGAARLLQIFGSEIVLVGDQRPGHALAQEIASARRSNPSARAIVVLRFGYVFFGADPREVYETFCEFETRCRDALPLPQIPSAPAADRGLAAKLAPSLRPAGHVLVWDDSDATRAFVNQPHLVAAAALGPASPRDVAVTKRVPCVMRDAEDLSLYRAEYESYARAASRDGLPALDPSPRVMLVPGLGVWTTGRSYRDALAAREVFRRTMRIIVRCGKAWAPCSPEESLRYEYWPLRHERERRRQERDRPGAFVGRVAWIGHATSPRGRAAADLLTRQGAHVMLVDGDVDGLRELGGSIGARAAAVRCRLDDERQVLESFRQCALAFGGVDIVICHGERFVMDAAHSLFLEQGFSGCVIVDGAMPEAPPAALRVNAIRTDGAWDAALEFLASDRAAAIQHVTL